MRDRARFILLKVVDADGIELRSSHRLARRTYVSVGPTYLWHIDGYDKIHMDLQVMAS